MPLLRAIHHPSHRSALPHQTDLPRTHHSHKKKQQQQQWQLSTIPPSTLCCRPACCSVSAHQRLDEIPHRDTFAWNTLIATHIADGEAQDAIVVYREMLLQGARPDKRTIPRVLTAASLAGSLPCGRQAHGHALKMGLADDDYIVTALMTMYGKTEGAGSASKILDRSSSKKRNSVSWTQLAKLYLEEGKPALALGVFRQMVDSSCVPVDPVSLSTALKACRELKSIHECKRVCDVARRSGLEFDLLVSNSVLKLYVECGCIEDGKLFLERMPSKDAISWTTIIGGYVKNGEFNSALKLFRRAMMCPDEGVMKLDQFALSSILPACARMTAGKNGKEIHGHIIRRGLVMNLPVQNALMDMYVKSGHLDLALKIFERSAAERDTISWTIMILGYSLHGQGEVGVKLFRKMEAWPGKQHLDQTAYAAVLHACNAACLVENGNYYFNCIAKPEIEQFVLMVNLLARAGRFEDARAFIEKHGIGRLVQVQRALLDGCRIHRNVMLGKHIAEQLIELEPLNAHNYILLSNLYASKAKWDDVKEQRQTISDMGLLTKKAFSWIEVRNKVHAFGVGDVSHPRSEAIRWELQGLMKRMEEEEEGYQVEQDFSLHEVDEERESIPSGHSEMLAIAFGLLSIQGTIRVTKNLRVCRSCHSSAKWISKIVGREILLKDPYRFHHFKDGCCSCNDYW